MKLEKLKPMSKKQKLIRIPSGLVIAGLGTQAGILGLVLIIAGLGLAGNAIFAPKHKDK